MLRLPYRVRREQVSINVIESDDDLVEAFSFLNEQRPDHTICIDTEATGLAMYSSNFRLRTIQLGDANTAYVYRMQSARDRNARRLLDLALSNGVSMHNAPFDTLAIDATGLYRLEDMQGKIHDTKILSHLLDPRAKMDGGIGHALKPLSAFYIDPEAPDTQDDLKSVFAAHGWNMQTGWANISLDDRTYLLYAGLDVIYGSRLAQITRKLVNDRGYGGLARMEHEFQQITTRMQRRGFRIDVPYTEWMISHLKEQHDEGVIEAGLLGVDNINSAAQISAVLMDAGWQPELFTSTGKPKLDKAVMTDIMKDEHCPAHIHSLIGSVIKAKRALKWNKAYATAMLDARDPYDHVHASINSLQARTGRMSISNPPLQQLPSRGDDAWLIRRSVIADEGKVIISADLDQVEFRVLAALANISAMKDAIRNGRDLHDYTAELVFGPGFTPGQRSLMKGVGFGRVFGGGARTLARQTGIPVATARTAIEDYDRVYHELPAYSKALIAEAKADGGAIHSYYGRFLPADLGREYALVNYSVQSPARDWLALSAIKMVADGLDDHLLLFVHDETLAQADEREAEDVAHAISECMSGTLEDVPITSGGDVYGKSWAEGYIKRDEDGTVRSKGSGNIIEDWRDAA